MINKIILFSIKNKLIIGIMMIAWIGLGIYSMQKVPIGAVPDITNNQVQVITTSPNLGTQDIEQFVTYPVELAMANLPGVVEIRSISRFGLSVVTIVFEDDMGTYLPRQLVSEKLENVKGQIPQKFGAPYMGPISTGLGEIYQYTLEVEPEFKDKYTDVDLRTYQDWIVKRQMAMLKGVVEVNSFGGNIKQYEVAVNPERLKSMGISIAEIFNALEINNENTGGAYIVKNHKANFIRGEGLARSLDDIKMIVIKTLNGIPILIKDVATVQFGNAIRYGSVTKNGEGSAVGGMIMMLKGENSKDVIERVNERIAEIEKSLPEGITIEPFLNRSDLIERTTSTVQTNLLEGGLIVIFILVLFLGNFRGGLIVASTIPLSLLFAYIMMNIFGVWSNLMSLGAIDFGIIVDGAVIIVESVVFYTMQQVRKMKEKKKLSQDDLDDISFKSSSKMMNAAFFGQLIILIVFIPILTLQGVEGKMFTPMALTFSFVVIGAMILCLTYVPMVSSYFMSKNPSEKKMWGDKFIEWLQKKYEPILVSALNRKKIILAVSVVFLGLAVFTFSKMGGEFMPQLDEGDVAMHAILKPGSSLEETEKVCQQIEATILENFPEVKQVVSKIGVAEIPTDPMPMDIADMFLILKPKSEWKNFQTKEEFIEQLKDKLSFLPGINYEFSQPVEMRFNELMTGVRQDVAVKLFGEDLDVLAKYADKMAKIIATVEGVGDLKVESTTGLPQMTVTYEREKLAQYGLNIQELNTIVRTAFSGETAGVIFEGEKRFDLVVRLKDEHKQSIDDLKDIYVSLPNGIQIPLKEVAKIDYQSGPMQISREGTNRRTYVGINIRGRDVESVVNEIQDKLDAQLDLPSGYYLKYGGSFENLQRAKTRLLIVVPIALILIFVLLYFALKSFSQTLMIYMAIPLAAIGGIFSLWIRDMPFSISAGVGFIVLFGVAVLNGLVLITSMNHLKVEGLSLKDRIIKGTRERVRPIFLTASTDILGFMPMAISTGAGAEVQRPLATVVIGGMLTASVLTLIVIPILYNLVEANSERRKKKRENREENKTLRSGGISLASLLLLIGFSLFSFNSFAQTESSEVKLSLEDAIEFGLNNNGSIKSADFEIERLETLEKSAYDFGKTNVGFQYGNYNSFENDFAFSISQRFQFPTVYSNQKKLAKTNIEIGKSEKEVTTNDLVRDIKLAWYQLAYLKEVSKLLKHKDSVYKHFLRAAELRYKVEAGTLLEKITAETKITAIKVELTQNKANIKIYQKRLQILLGNPNVIDISTDYNPKKELSLNLDTTRIGSNPNLELLKNQIAVRENEINLNKSKMLPEFLLGYTNQSLIGNYDINGTSQFFDSSQRFSSVNATVSIPLWFKPDKSRIKASKIQQQIAEEDAKYYQTILNGEYERVMQDYLKYKETVAYYEDKALPQAELILLNSKKSFENDAIGYIEYIQGLDIGIEIEYNYLTLINQYNQSIIAIEYLVGK
ncbi:CusA/CzcA family heavy metal efflux RND transporter [Flavobacteriaceae bacterium AH-315-B10]|nr:CusA/CzcA family heavy metal efflux RND transporter [Flavobacteriaceae bacterium AH-315-B10]